jgi:hypothetical protein
VAKLIICIRNRWPDRVLFTAEARRVASFGGLGAGQWHGGFPPWTLVPRLREPYVFRKLPPRHPAMPLSNSLLTPSRRLSTPDARLTSGCWTALLEIMSTRCLGEVCREAEQILGGTRYSKSGGGALAEEISRDVRVFVTGGGSEEIMRDLCGRAGNRQRRARFGMARVNPQSRRMSRQITAFQRMLWNPWPGRSSSFGFQDDYFPPFSFSALARAAQETWGQHRATLRDSSIHAAMGPRRSFFGMSCRQRHRTPLGNVYRPLAAS